jgi:hypothetical protein
MSKTIWQRGEWPRFRTGHCYAMAGAEEPVSVIVIQKVVDVILCFYLPGSPVVLFMTQASAGASPGGSGAIRGKGDS